MSMSKCRKSEFFPQKLIKFRFVNRRKPKKMLRDLSGITHSVKDVSYVAMRLFGLNFIRAFLDAQKMRNEIFTEKDSLRLHYVRCKGVFRF